MRDREIPVVIRKCVACGTRSKVSQLVYLSVFISNFPVEILKCHLSVINYQRILKIIA